MVKTIRRLLNENVACVEEFSFKQTTKCGDEQLVGHFRFVPAKSLCTWSCILQWNNDSSDVLVTDQMADVSSEAEQSFSSSEATGDSVS